MLIRKTRAAEKDRVQPDARLGRLLNDRYDALAEARFRKVLPSMDETRKMLEDLFRQYVKRDCG